MRIPHFSKFIVWVATLTLLLGIGAPTIAQANTQKVNYVALGDSLAAGMTHETDLAKKISKGYTGMIADALEKQGTLESYTNKFAVPGYTTQNVLDDLVNNKAIDEKKIQDTVKSAHIITLSAGGNDFLQAAKIDKEKGTVTITPAQAFQVAGKIEANLANIFKTIKELNPSAKIYILGYYNILPYLSAEQQPLVKQVLESLNGIIHRVANENKATYVPLYGLFDADVAKYLPNKMDIHPSLDGYQLIADAHLKAFKTTPNFEDVTETHWAYKEIMQLVEGNVLKGVSNSEFGPEKTLTRQEAAEAIFQLIPLENSVPPNPGFTDVAVDHESYPAIAKLTQKGIFAKAEKFNPDAPLTRAQMAKILTLAFQLKGNQSANFKDISANHWAKTYIDALFTSKVTTGYSNHTFKPAANTTKADFAVFLVRASSVK
ncbi:S-layer homology domain-containing protein [Bacillus sp. CGMCC 1.16607]|uniref:S-layer homology domain-containing protein n=1 Tax=Bacillus sp. CGMCC 1.16607 TaxID=3351842 RepID=UPI003638C3D9